MTKKDKLADVSISYNQENGSIQISSNDPRIEGQPLSLEVPNGSSAYDTLFNLLNAEDTSDDPYPKRFTLTKEEINEFYDTHGQEEILIGLDSEHNHASMNMRKHHHTLIAGRFNGDKGTLQRAIYTTVLSKDYGNMYAFDLSGKKIPGSVHIHNSRIARTPADVLALIQDATTVLENRARTREQPTQWKPLYLLIDEYAEIKNSTIGREFEEWLVTILQQGGKYGIHVLLGTQKVSDEMLRNVSQYFTRQIVVGRVDDQVYNTVFGKPAEYHAGLFHDPANSNYFSKPDPTVTNAPPGRIIMQEDEVQTLIMTGFITPEKSDKIIVEKPAHPDTITDKSVFGNEFLEITEIGELTQYETLNI